MPGCKLVGLVPCSSGACSSTLSREWGIAHVILVPRELRFKWDSLSAPGGSQPHLSRQPTCPGRKEPLNLDT